MAATTPQVLGGPEAASRDSDHPRSGRRRPPSHRVEPPLPLTSPMDGIRGRVRGPKATAPAGVRSVSAPSVGRFAPDLVEHLAHPLRLCQIDVVSGAPDPHEAPTLADLSHQLRRLSQRIEEPVA